MYETVDPHTYLPPMRRCSGIARGGSRGARAPPSRTGGTGPVGPAKTEPLFSDQVINIHNLNSYAVVRPYGRPLLSLLWSRPDVRRLGVRTRERPVL